MKKVLSIMLATMMVVSLFAMNASAAVIEPTYTVIEGAHPEYVYAEQDFSDITANADFTEISYAGTASVADGAVSFTSESEKNATIGSLNSTKPITMGEFKVAFDIRRNDSLTSPTCIFVVVQRAANAESTDANLKKYGVCIPVAHLTTGAWYEYEVTFSEETYLTTNDVTKIASVKYRAKGAESWTNIYHITSWLPAADKFRSCGSNVYSVDATELSFHTRVYDNKMAGEEVATDINYSLDNIKAYTPESAGKEVAYDYPLIKGTTNLIKAEEVTMGAYAGGNANPGEYKYTTNMEALTEGQSRYIIYTFDAINTVKGMPICIHIGGAGTAYGLDILSTDEILNKWYTYKVVCIETYGKTYLDIKTICRKPADGSGDWEVYNASIASKLPSDEWSTAPVAGWWNDYDITSAKFHVRGSLSSKSNVIRLVWRQAAESLVDDDVTDLTATKWTFRNQQVVEGSLAIGEAKVVDGVLTVDADIATIANTAPVLAIYDTDNRMVDVDFTAFASGTGELLLSADYADGNTAKILVWEGTEGPEIPTSIVWDITDSITK